MTSYQVRPASLADLDVLVDLFDSYRQFHQCSSSIAAIRSFLLTRFYRNESSLLLIEDSLLQAVGFAQLMTGFSSLLLARTVVLNDLFIKAEFRRQGAASFLLEQVIQLAQESGAARLSLSMDVSNLLAQQIYQKKGWQPDEQFCVFHLDLQPDYSLEPRRHPDRTWA